MFQHAEFLRTYKAYVQNPKIENLKIYFEHVKNPEQNMFSSQVLSFSINEINY